jgi:DNA-binding MarR family transcriptional regulator/GNAT superfamily N-acetyltransferase
MNRQISQLRSFNRTVTRRIGALDDDFMGRHRPLGESRLLFEIGPEGERVRRLRGRLGLDSGYASRMLQSLEAKGLIRVEKAEHDGRVRVARLTDLGRCEVAELDRLSDRSVEAILDPLTPRQRERLVDAMTEVERLLEASAVTIAAEKPSSSDAIWCVGQYFAELDRRFAGGFDAGQSAAGDIAELTPPAGWLLIARTYDEPVGCGALRVDPAGYGEIKRVWIAARMRGLGLGRRMLKALEAQAAAAGLTLLRLDTNGVLAEAQALYRTGGYTEIPCFNDNPYAHHWFEKRLV